MSEPVEVPTVTAVDQALAAGDTSAFLQARRAERSGTPLEPSSVESASTEPAEQAASTDATPAPASEPGSGTSTGAEGRKRQLRAEIEDLLRQRAALRKDVAQTKPAVSSPAAAEPTNLDIDRYKALPDYPKADDYADYDDLVTARAAFVAAQQLQASEQRHTAERQTSAMLASQQAMVAKGNETFDDFEDVLQAAVVAGVEFPAHVGATVLTHPDGHVIARAAADQAVRDPAFLQSIADPVAFGMFVGQTLAARAAEAMVPLPVVSKAPEPPRTLGRKTSDVLDPIEVAVRDGNTEAFLAARRAQRRAAMR